MKIVPIRPSLHLETCPSNTWKITILSTSMKRKHSIWYIFNHFTAFWNWFGFPTFSHICEEVHELLQYKQEKNQPPTPKHPQISIIPSTPNNFHCHHNQNGCHPGQNYQTTIYLYNTADLHYLQTYYTNTIFRHLKIPNTAPSIDQIRQTLSST